MKRKYTIEISQVDPSNPAICDALWKLLAMIDHEFVPPLSARESTTEMILAGKAHTTTMGPRTYFNNILKQSIVMAQVEGEWVGFLSFQHNCNLELLKDYTPCNYLTTIGVSPYSRNIGIARSMYRYILNDLAPELQAAFWATRTWSTNNDHLHLLVNLGFSCVATIKNHRGEGVDTLYFAYQTPEKHFLPTKNHC